MLLSVHCTCGETYTSEDWYVGRKIRCWKCDRIIVIEKPGPTSQSQAPASGSCHSRRKFAAWIAAGLLLALFVLGRLSNSEQVKEVQQSRSDASLTLSPDPSPSPNSSFTSLNDLLARAGASPNGDWTSHQVPDSGALRSLDAPANGAELARQRGPKGYAELLVSNGTSYDAAVKLVDSATNKTHRFVYVRAHSEVTIGKIGACECILKFSSGGFWDRGQNKFLLNPAFFRFDEPLAFKRTISGNKAFWNGYRVTLHPVAGGTAQTAAMTESEFEDY